MSVGGGLGDLDVVGCVSMRVSISNRGEEGRLVLSHLNVAAIYSEKITYCDAFRRDIER